MNMSAYCPECDSRIRLTKKLRIGQQFACEECREMLEVVGLKPLELTWALDEDESQDAISYNNYETTYEYDMDALDDYSSYSDW